MRRRMFLAGTFFLGTLSAATRAQAADAEAVLGVAATFSVLADLVARVGGSRVSVASLAGPGTDVAAFKPAADARARLKDAAILFEVGLGLEGWLTAATRTAGFKGRRVVVSDGSKPRTSRQAGRTVTDPHIWMDPRQARLMVSNIASALAAARPAHAEEFADRARTFVAEIAAADSATATAFATVPDARRRLVTTRPSLAYFAARYGIDVKLATARTKPTVADSLSPAVPGGTLPVIYTDTLSAPSGPAATYLDLLRHDTAELIRAMS